MAKFFYVYLYGYSLQKYIIKNPYVIFFADVSTFVSIIFCIFLSIYKKITHFEDFQKNKNLKVYGPKNAHVYTSL